MRRFLESLGNHPTPNQTSQASTAQHQPSPPANWRTHRSGAATREVPVTVMQRDRFPTGSDRQPAPVGPINRLEAAEAALKAERAARSELERSLTQANARIRDLQTQLAHAELAHQEAIEAMRAEGKAARDLIQDLRAHLRAIEDARQSAPDAINTEGVVHERAEEAVRLGRNTGDHSGRQAASTSARRDKGSSRLKAVTPRQEPRRAARASSAASRRSGMQATKMRKPIAAKKTRSTSQAQAKKAARVKQGDVRKTRPEVSSGHTRNAATAAARVKRQKAGRAVRGRLKEKSKRGKR